MSHYDLSQNFNRLDLSSRPGDGSYSGHGSPYPPQQQQSYPPQQHQPYPPQQHQSYPPPAASQPPYSPPPDKPPLPSGWVPQYDPEYQRWFYYSKDTQRSQWEAPGSQGAGGDTRGHGSGGGYGAPSHGYSGGAPGYGGSYGGHGDHGSGSHGGDDHGKKDKDKKKDKKSGMGGMLLAGAAGLGAGALIGHALGDSDSDSDHGHHGGHTTHHHYAAAAPAAAYGGYGGAPAYIPPAEPGIPQYNYEGERLSESDKESVRSAREDYEEAYRKAHDSDASSSDQEDLREAREEYVEEYEEAYYDD